MPTYNDWDPQMSLQRQRWEGRIRSWNNTPNFGTIPKNQRPINGYSDQHFRATALPTHEELRSYPSDALLTSTDYTWDLNRVYSFVNYIQAKPVIAATWGPLVGNLENDLEIKLLGKIADAKVNLEVMLAEASKTSNLILDTCHRVDRAYRAFRRGDLKGVASNLNITPRKLHKSWLEYKYGWMPLLMDAKGAAEFFAQQYIVRPPKFRAQARRKVVMALDLSEQGNPWGGPPTQLQTQFFTRSLEAKMVAWVELSSPNLAALQQLGLTNPALVKWELIPFSFVFDWFIHIGNWLEAQTALHGVTVIRAFYSFVLSEGTVWNNGPSDRHDASYRYQSSGQDYTLSKRHYNRVPLSLDPSSLIPPANSHFTWQKLVTSLSLVRGGYRGTVRV